ncbi:protein lin-52 homolog isoform X1 [Manis pentadactyla]|uniref:protein lin-52 homolog isoform X1 n=1 Tax=Manis pentadactyla TaxID=143292 RepID=UPI00255C2E03|nr:protein lin-52 homolog isoform X1 [Manis pentadactyla]
MGWKMASPTDGTDLEASLLSFEKLDRASPDLWPEQLPGVAEFAASFKSPITSSPPKWMAEIERDDIDMLKELGSLTTANLMEKVRGLQNLAYQLGLDESMERSRSLVHLDREATGCCVPRLAGYGAHCWNSSNQGNNHLSHRGVSMRLDPKATEWCDTDAYPGQMRHIFTAVRHPLY